VFVIVHQVQAEYDFRQCVLTSECEQIAAEMIAGEERLKEKPEGDSQRLSRMLGLAERVRSHKSSKDPTATKKPEDVVDLKPRVRRRVGQRKPKRDEVP